MQNHKHAQYIINLLTKIYFVIHIVIRVSTYLNNYNSMSTLFFYIML